MAFGLFHFYLLLHCFSPVTEILVQEVFQLLSYSHLCIIIDAKSFQYLLCSIEENLMQVFIKPDYLQVQIYTP